MAEDGHKSLKFRQSNGDSSSITHDILLKLHVHNHTMVIYIQYKFLEIPSIGYLEIAEDRKIIEIQVTKGNNSTSSITDGTPKNFTYITLPW